MRGVGVCGKDEGGFEGGDAGPVVGGLGVVAGVVWEGQTGSGEGD